MLIADFYPVILALFAAAATGLVGSFALMKKMTLAGDTMSHIALPGLGLAFLWGINPVIGAAATLAIGAIFVWRVQQKTDFATETSIGVVFAAAIAIGALVTPSEDIIGALFGGAGAVSLGTLVLYALLSLLVIFFILKFRNKLVLSLFNQDLAATSGVNVSWLNLGYFLIFALTLLLGLRFLGTLLVGALVIVPAAIGRQLSENLSKFMLTSAAASMLSVGIGYGISAAYHLETGPTVVVVATILFLLSLLKKRS